MDDRSPPLAGAPLEQVVAAVLAGLHQNPYRADRSITSEAVERFVRKFYFDVEPWPFAALFTDTVTPLS